MEPSEASLLGRQLSIKPPVRPRHARRLDDSVPPSDTSCSHVDRELIDEGMHLEGGPARGLDDPQTEAAAPGADGGPAIASLA